MYVCMYVCMYVRSWCDLSGYFRSYIVGSSVGDITRCDLRTGKEMMFPLSSPPPPLPPSLPPPPPPLPLLSPSHSVYSLAPPLYCPRWYREPLQRLHRRCQVPAVLQQWQGHAVSILQFGQVPQGLHSELSQTTPQGNVVNVQRSLANTVTCSDIRCT